VCGIVGYVGLGDPVVPVIEGLSRLEYRGYDSAGIAVLDRANFQVYKKTGN
jgi:glucosamine--fructose-6-phosphate aminotransferase (isomerizing)